MRRFFPPGIRVRMTAWFVLIFGATLVAFSVVFYEQFSESQHNEFDAALYNHAIDVAGSIEYDGSGDISLQSAILSHGGKVFPFSLAGSFLLLRDIRGRAVARSIALGRAQLPITDQEWERALLGIPSFRSITAEDLPLLSQFDKFPYRMITVQVNKPDLPRMVLQIAVPTTYLERQLRELLRLFLIAVPLTLVIATFGGLYLSRKAFNPVREIILKARSIGVDRLSERLPIPLAEDEIKQLALTLNRLLERLEQAFLSQERFVADASHQLKTPLAILRGELDLTRSRQRSPEEVAEFLQSATQEVDHLSRLVEDLLLLARVDAGKDSLSFAQVRLDETVLEVLARLEKAFQEKKVRTRFDLEGNIFEVQGDRELLHCLFFNLIENALKYSPEDATVHIRLREESDSVCVEVQDQGPGIPEDQREKVFERFYRIESLKKIPGSGLGLAIARRIVDVHQGALELDSRPGKGSVFRAWIKKV